MFEEIKNKRTNLQKRRLDAGLSQSQLAKKSGLALGTIRSLEQRQRKIENMSITSIVILCNVLKCRIENIVDDENLQYYAEKISEF